MYAINTTKEKIDETKLKNNPNDIKLLTIAANKAVENNDINEAIIKFEKIFEIDTSNLYAQLALGIFYYKNEDYLKSKKYLLPVLTLKSDKDNAAAIKEFGNDYFEEISFAFYSLGHIYHLEGDFDNAIKYKQTAVGIDKKYAKLKTY
jgi:tetratricopeptide (TPR) repeat protein